MYDPIKHNRDLIEELLTQDVPKCETVREQFIRERGYLTGLLSRLMHDDSYIYHAVKNRIAARQEPKRR